VALTWLISYIL